MLGNSILLRQILRNSYLEYDQSLGTAPDVTAASLHGMGIQATTKANIYTKSFPPNHDGAGWICGLLHWTTIQVSLAAVINLSIQEDITSPTDYIYIGFNATINPNAAVFNHHIQVSVSNAGSTTHLLVELDTPIPNPIALYVYVNGTTWSVWVNQNPTVDTPVLTEVDAAISDTATWTPGIIRASILYSGYSAATTNEAGHAALWGGSA